VKNEVSKSALSRRAFVGKLATGAAGAAVALTAGVKGAQALTATERSTGRLGEKDRAQEALASAVQSAPEVNGEGAAAVTAPPGSVIVTPDTPPPWELLQPLALGSEVGHGWRVADLSSVVDGSCVLTLENERGRCHRVHVCGNDGRPQGVVYTKRLDLVVMNGGRGDLPTEEGLAQAVAEVGHVLAANEAKWESAPVVTALLPQAERVRLYGAAAKLR